MPQVKIIQPIAEQAKKLRVAAYARVSSDSVDQLNSFATQVAYYTDFIQSKDEWEFAGLYADKAVSGTTADKRNDFQRLLADCRAGKIDRILVKSISRFARNTLDCIQTVRELKQLGIAVEFEKEQIDTGNMGSEMLLSILGSAAQEESLSISKNLKWSYRRRMKSGDFITCSAPLGYYLKNGTLIPDPQEVPIVEYIFSSYLTGKSTTEIARSLNETGLKTDKKSSGHWSPSMIKYILSNEKYIGDSLVQKYYTPDELPLREKRNKGELSQYYIQHSHPAIISREVFNSVQEILKKRSAPHTTKGRAPKVALSNMMRCGECGSIFHKHYHNGKNRWLCALHKKSKDLCLMPILHEEEIHSAFLSVHNKLLDNMDILKVMLLQLNELHTKVIHVRPDLESLNEKISDLIKQNHSLSRLQAKGCIDSAIFIERCNRNNKLIEELRQELRQRQEPDDTSSAIEGTRLLLDLLEGAKPMLEFDSSVFRSMVKQITVYQEKFCFQLVNGLVLEERRTQS